MKKFVLFLVVGGFGLVGSGLVGCDGGDGVVAQPDMSAEELQAQQEAYEAEMEADAGDSGYEP